MNLYEYTVTGDPKHLLAVMESALAQMGKQELFLTVITSNERGITLLDVCPTDADFQGWINGEAWRQLKAALGGNVEVRPLGEISVAVARDSVVEVVRHQHAPA